MEEGQHLSLSYDGTDKTKGLNQDKGQTKGEASKETSAASKEVSADFGELDLDSLGKRKKKKRVAKTLNEKDTTQAETPSAPPTDKAEASPAPPTTEGGEKEKPPTKEKVEGQKALGKRPMAAESSAPRAPKRTKVLATKQKGPSTAALQEVPHWRKLIEDPSIGSSGDPPSELLSFAKGVFEKSTPAYLRRENYKQPFEVFTSKVVKFCFEMGSMATMAEQQALELESIRYDDPPESMVQRWEKEKQALNAIMDEKAQAWKLEKEAFEKKQKSLEQLQTDLASARKELSEEKKERAEEKAKLNDEISSLKVEANTKLQRFLQSPALITLAMNIAAPAMKNGLYGLAKALGNHYPFKPEELGLEIVPTATPNFAGYSWDEEQGVMLTPEGEVVKKPTGVFPDLKNLSVKYPWKSEEWPDEYAEDDEDGGDDDDADGGEKI